LISLHETPKLETFFNKKKTAGKNFRCHATLTLSLVKPTKCNDEVKQHFNRDDNFAPWPWL